MNPMALPYVLIMIFAAIVCICIGVYVWPAHRKNPETVPLILLMAGITPSEAAKAAPKEKVSEVERVF